MKITGFKKGMNKIPYGERFELKDALKRALGVNTDRTVEAYAAGDRTLEGEKAEAVAQTFATFGIDEWWDKKEETELGAETSAL